MREITLEVVLAGLARSDFFGCAAFQGGTCLRILHGLDRFSEDLDFALLAPAPAFSLAPYLDQIRTELGAYGYEIEIDDRSRAGEAVRKAFVKDDPIGKLLRLNYRPPPALSGNFASSWRSMPIRRRAPRTRCRGSTFPFPRRSELSISPVSRPEKSMPCFVAST